MLWVEAVCDIGENPPQLSAHAVAYLAQRGTEGLADPSAVATFAVLSYYGRMAQFGGRESGVKVADMLDRLLQANGLAGLTPDENDQIISAADDALSAGRGSPEGAAPIFQRAVEARDRKLLYMNEYGFFVVSEPVWCKWVHTQLTAGLALTDWYVGLAPPPEQAALMRDHPDRTCQENLTS